MEPIATRPYMPGYGIVGPEEGTGLLPWAWAVARLEASHDFWLATQCPDGRPHVMPVWAIWDGDALWWSSSLGSRKARNVAVNPRAVMTTDNALDPVVLEGDVEPMPNDEDIARFVDLTNAKYRTDYTVSFFEGSGAFRLHPVWAFGLTEGDFAGSPTRWTF